MSNAMMTGLIALALALGLAPASAAPAKKSAAVSQADRQIALFKKAGEAIPKALAKLGYEKFGALELARFQERMGSVQVKVLSEAEIGRRNGDGRMSARWEHTAQGAVIWFDPVMASNTGLGPILPVLALHEYLGILGFNDKRYLTSLGLLFLAQTRTRQVLTAAELGRVAALISRQQAPSKVVGGGAVGVGGGGQSMTLLYRGMMMMRTLDFFERARTPADRVAVMNALIELWTTQDEVTYRRGSRPRVEFSHRP